MYDYRQMTPEERIQILEERRRKRQPWHSPPHREITEISRYLVTAACYEHKHIIGQSQERMTECETEVWKICVDSGADIYAWCILPNHCHILLGTVEIAGLLKRIGQFHGRSSFKWNGEDGQRGRKCWFIFSSVISDRSATSGQA
jgi:putative transposase